MRILFTAAILTLPITLTAQGSVPPYVLNITNPLATLSPLGIAATTVEQINFVHLPGDPPNVYLAGMTCTGLAAANGGAGGWDVLSGKYDVLTDTFTPNNEAASLNTSGTEWGLTFYHTGLYATFDTLNNNPPMLATRTSLTAPWTVVGPITGLPTQSYYDPSLANYKGQPMLLHVLGNDIAMSPIDLSTGAIIGPSVVIVHPSRAGSMANSPTAIVDSNGELIGLSHHDLLPSLSDNDHYMSLDLDPNTPAVLMNDTTTWTNNGDFIGGRFFDAELTPSPYHVLTIDTYWNTGGRAPVGGTMEVRAFVPPSSSSNTWLTYLAIGGGFAPTPVSVPPLQGQLGLSSVLLSLAMPVHNNMNGEAMLSFKVPNDPSLSGKSVPVQSATLDVASGIVTIGNTAALTID